MRAYKIILIALVLCLLASTAYGQEVARSAPVANEETIIVTARWQSQPLPLAYESEVQVSAVTFTAEQNFSGRTHFQFTRPLLDLGDQAGFEFHREWNDGRGRELVPENAPPDFRFVIRW